MCIPARRLLLECPVNLLRIEDIKEHILTASSNSPGRPEIVFNDAYLRIFTFALLLQKKNNSLQSLQPFFFVRFSVFFLLKPLGVRQAFSLLRRHSFGSSRTRISVMSCGLDVFSPIQGRTCLERFICGR